MAKGLIDADATLNRHVTEIRQPSFIPSTDRLVRPVDAARDHVIGPGNAPITLVEYGSYACLHW